MTSVDVELQNCATAFLRATEWNFETLEELLSSKSSSQRRIDRQADIIRTMLRTCTKFRHAMVFASVYCERTREALTLGLAEKTLYDIIKFVREGGCETADKT